MCGWCSDLEYPLADLLLASTLLSLFVETLALPPQRLDDANRPPAEFPPMASPP